MKKLSDEELSRVLSQQAIGKLDHGSFYSSWTECGCVAGAALCLASPYYSRRFSGGPVVARAWEVSDAIGRADHVIYPTEPEDLLQLLADKGLA